MFKFCSVKDREKNNDFSTMKLKNGKDRKKYGSIPFVQKFMKKLKFEAYNF